MARKKLTIKYIREQFIEEGYELLTEIYENAKQKLDYICPEGHNHCITWSDWKSGRRCFCCSNRNKGNYKRMNIHFIRSEFAKERYQLLTAKYKNQYQKLKYICFNGHKHSISWNNWQQGARCPYCSGKAKPTIEFIRSEFKKEGWRFESIEYINNNRKLDYICTNGHKHSINWGNWQQGKRCPYCIGIISKGEIEIRNFVKSLGIEVSSNDRNQIFNPKTGYAFELDIFMPNLNKAIEYNGEYWHQDKSKDLLKQKLCEEKEINLLTIWDKEWKTEKTICKDRIKEFIFN